MPYVEYDESEAVCPQCGSAFRSVEILEAHVRESHADPGAEADLRGSKAVKCSVCGASLPSVAALGRHNRTSHVG